MRIPSGVTDQYIYFVAVDATDLKTRETGFSSFTVYRSRNGAAAVAMTSPTINETDSTNMPGVYELLLDEDMSIGTGNDSEAMVFHITHAGMAPTTLEIELYRPKISAGNTLGVESDGDLTKVNTLDGHTAQTGDNFARLGAPAGASVSADIAAIEAQTDDIGAAGAGLTAIPWNSAWDAEVQSEVNDALVALGLDHLINTSVAGGDVADDSIIAKIVSASATADWDDFVNTTDSLQALRDRGDSAWTTGAGSSITQILNVVPLIPTAIDLADTATFRLGLALVNSVDDLPSTAEITPGTVTIERKAAGGTSWSPIVSSGAMSESAGVVYYDEVFDSGTGYAAGDSLRITFLSVSITADSNTHEVCDSNGIQFYTYIREDITGVGLTAIPWNSAWDAEVQSEVDDALVAQGLDHLVQVAATGGDVTDNSLIAQLASKAATADFSDFDNTTDSLEAIRDRGDSDWSSGSGNPNLLLDAEIGTVNSQTEFTLATGSDVDDAYNDQAIVLYDDTNSDYPSVRKINDYVGATKTVTIDSAPDFTLAADDSVKIFVTAPGTTAPTAAQNAAAVWDNVDQDGKDIIKAQCLLALAEFGPVEYSNQVDPETELVIYRGVTYDEIITVVNAQGQAIDLTTVSTVTLEVRVNGHRSLLLATVTPTVSDASNGQIRILITDEVTNTFDLGAFTYDVILTDSGGAKTRPVGGTFKVKEGATQHS